MPLHLFLALHIMLLRAFGLYPSLLPLWVVQVVLQHLLLQLLLLQLLLLRFSQSCRRSVSCIQSCKRSNSLYFANR